MAWTQPTRGNYERRCARNASDLTDAEWELIEPLMPSPNRTTGTKSSLELQGFYCGLSGWVSGAKRSPLEAERTQPERRKGGMQSRCGCQAGKSRVRGCKVTTELGRA